jgi:hypothetical protein
MTPVPYNGENPELSDPLFSRTRHCHSPVPVARVPDDTDSGGALLPNQPPSDNRATAPLPRGMLPRRSRTMIAARTVEAITIAKERTVQRSWVWTLSGTSKRQDEREVVAASGSSEVQHLYHLYHLGPGCRLPPHRAVHRRQDGASARKNSDRYPIAESPSPRHPITLILPLCESLRASGVDFN